MSKSVFISSTSLDLKAHREAVDKAIRRLQLRPINMDDFGSQPGGASGVSLRQVAQADIFIGIIARRYGYIPDGQERSVTEQEYDEAVRRGIPRLMYLLKPTADWPPEYEETTARDKLDAFRAKIEKTDVRSFFTTPDELAAEVTADLTNFLTAPAGAPPTSQAKRGLSGLWKAVLAIIAFLALLAIILALFPEQQRENFLHTVGMLPASPTPTATVTATLLPTSTSTPTMTPTATPEFAAAQQGEILVIVAEFDRQGGQTATSKTMVEQLQASIQTAASDPQLKDLPVRIGRTAEVITTSEAARALANRNNATIVIWGSIANSVLTSHYEITPRWGGDVYNPVEQTDFKADLSASASVLDQVTYHFENAIDQTYITELTLAQLLYSGQQYQQALPLFESALSQVQAESTQVQQARGADVAWFYVGYIRRDIQSDSAAAEQAYNQAISLNPQFAEAYNNLGNIDLAQGNLDAAISKYTAAIQFKPTLEDAYYNRGTAYSDPSKPDLEAANRDYTVAISLNARDVNAYTNRGNNYSVLGNLDEAIKDFNTAISIDSNHTNAYRGLGNDYYTQKRFPDALRAYQKYLALAGANPAPLAVNRVRELEAMLTAMPALTASPTP